MHEWTRPFRRGEQPGPSAQERSLYLIPTYDDATGALELIHRHHAAIFEAELSLWCDERQLWPSPRDFALFERWFELELFPLVEDLGTLPLRTYAASSGFEQRLRDLFDRAEPHDAGPG